MKRVSIFTNLCFCFTLLFGTVFAGPDFTVQPAAALTGLDWIKGEAVTFQPGQIYVVEFWATWCPPCKASIPHLTETQQHYKDQKVTIIGISNEPVETVKPFVESQGEKMGYTVATDPKRQIHKHYMEAYGQQGIPTAFIVDGKGNLVWYGSPFGEMDSVLEQVTAGTFDPVAYAAKRAEEEAKMKKLEQLFMDYFTKVSADGPTKETDVMAESLLNDAPAEALNAIAWNLLTRVEKNKRDLKTAVAAAQKANAMTDGKEPAILDTYALALFENGQVDEAIKTQQQAIDALPEDAPENAKTRFTETLHEYQAAKK